MIIISVIKFEEVSKVVWVAVESTKNEMKQIKLIKINIISSNL